jgi:hypothetical protein
MSKSLSNRQSLEKALLDVVAKHQAKLSGLLYDLETFLKIRDIIKPPPA